MSYFDTLTQSTNQERLFNDNWRIMKNYMYFIFSVFFFVFFFCFFYSSVTNEQIRFM